MLLRSIADFVSCPSQSTIICCPIFLCPRLIRELILEKEDMPSLTIPDDIVLLVVFYQKSCYSHIIAIDNQSIQANICYSALVVAINTIRGQFKVSATLLVVAIKTIRRRFRISATLKNRMENIFEFRNVSCNFVNFCQFCSVIKCVQT